MSGCRNMKANQTGGDTVAVIVPTTTAMSLMCMVPPSMPAEKNTAMLKANSQQRTIKALSAQERLRHRKWLSANSATETTLMQQHPMKSGTLMYRSEVKR